MFRLFLCPELLSVLPVSLSLFQAIDYFSVPGRNLKRSYARIYTTGMPFACEFISYHELYVSQLLFLFCLSQSRHLLHLLNRFFHVAPMGICTHLREISASTISSKCLTARHTEWPMRYNKTHFPRNSILIVSIGTGTDTCVSLDSPQERWM
jgi:hypothetical protein